MDIDELKRKVLGKVLMFLAYRVRTRKEITDRLERYLKSISHVSDDVKRNITQQIFEYLDQNKLIDDEAFSKLFVESKSSGKGALGKRAIENRLIAKGISRTDASKCVNAEVSEEDEFKTAVGLLKKKYKGFEARDKMGKFLLSRGFSYNTSKQAVDYLLKRP